MVNTGPAPTVHTDDTPIVVDVPLARPPQSEALAVSDLDRAIFAARDLRVLDEICFAIAAELAASPSPPMAKTRIAMTTSMSVSPFLAMTHASDRQQGLDHHGETRTNKKLPLLTPRASPAFSSWQH